MAVALSLWHASEHGGPPGELISQAKQRLGR